MILSIDIETRSSVDLIKHGVYPYIEAEDFEILLLAYAFDDEEVQVVELFGNKILPVKVRNAILDDDVIKYAFNANFERTCLSKYFGVYLSPMSFRCTQAMSLRLGMAHSLDSVSKLLELDTKKDASGKELIKYFNNHHPSENLEKWEKFKEYCKQDVIVERNIRKALQKYEDSDLEEYIYILDQVINDRGVAVDKLLIDKAIALNLYSENLLKSELKKKTSLENIKSTVQFKNYLEKNFNIKVNSVNKESLEKIRQSTTDTKLIELLDLRNSLTKTSIKKYEAMNRTATKDNRIRGLFQYYGANKTGRWSGRLVQVQNLPQTKLDNLDLPRSIVKNQSTKEAYEILDMLYLNTEEVLSNLIRTAFVPSANKKFIISDFSAIEARVLAYISKEMWRIKVFNSHGKIYEASAAQMFKVPISEITKESKLRQSGKIAELALGYQGSVNALKAMGSEKMGLSEAFMKSLVKNFRDSNRHIVSFWKSVEAAAIATVSRKCNFKYMDLYFIYKEDYLFIMLPTGRKLAYYKPKLELDKNYNRQVLTYKSVNQTTKKFEKTYTYGGRLTENIVQAISRDILAAKMLELESCGYNIVLHVHDEVVLEVEESVSIEEVNKIMEESLPYMKDLKLRVDSQESYYYKK